MPVDPNAPVRISAYNWVPPFARGLVRDLRVRWALEEAGIPYAVRKLDARAERPSDYFAEQPFGQVPSYRDESISLFESGAIVIHIGETCDTLLPSDAKGRGRAISWAIAALNSIEPSVMNLATIDFFNPDAAWARESRPRVAAMVESRLDRLVDHLEDREWLEGRFTAGDLLMVTVLRALKHTDLVEARPTLAAYKKRGEERPAFERALAAQLADFEEGEAAAAA
ncbi:glutathione S-transferase family protein [Sphingosinicella sp. CPCC 101087]|uniref:glutathione S-transferase family protein n=1 Tax=Sphingosinicella sp. CPCC 101087 TaxID=2497754 RepID=UPI00101BCF82|nr:glutathione S-transferase family protein [Sphingosinicella sp. CPCC 101087]